MSVQTITPGILAATAVQLKTVVLKQMAARTAIYTKYCEPVSSAGVAKMVYRALGDFPTMRELIGDADIKEIVETGWESPNKVYHNTIGIPREDIERSDMAAHQVRLRMIGDDAAVFPDKLMAQRLMGGFTGKCYNGQTFFSETHVHFKGGKQQFSNKSTLKLTGDSFKDTRKGMTSIYHENGDAFHTGLDLELIVGPNNLDAGEKILENDRLANGETNVNKGKAKLTFNPLITDDSWYLVNNFGVAKPFVFQEEVKMELNWADSKNTEDFLIKQRFLFQAYRRCNLDYFFPQVIAGSTGEDDPE